MLKLTILFLCIFLTISFTKNKIEICLKDFKIEHRAYISVVLNLKKNLLQTKCFNINKNNRFNYFKHNKLNSYQ